MKNVKIKGQNPTDYEMTEQMAMLAAMFPDAEFTFDPKTMQGEMTGKLHKGKASVQVQINGWRMLQDRASVWLFVNVDATMKSPDRLREVAEYLVRMAKQIDSDLGVGNDA